MPQTQRGISIHAVLGALRTPKSLARRLLLWYFASVGVIVSLACATLYAAMLNEVHWVDDQALTKRFHSIEGIVSAGEEREFALDHEVNRDLEGPRRILVRVIADGIVIAESSGMAQSAPSSLFASAPVDGSAPQTRTVQRPGGIEFRTLVATTTWREGPHARQAVVQIAADTSLDDLVVARYRRILTAVVLIALAAGAIGGLLLTVGLIAPLYRIADRIGAANFDSLRETLPSDGLTTELQQLVRQHNAMRLRLADAYDSLQTYADNAAHELRTPLNKMLLELGVAEVRERSPEQYQEALAKFAGDCRELVQLVDRLLFLARMSNNQERLFLEAVDISEELQRIVEYFEISAAEDEKTLRVGESCSVVGLIDRVCFQRAIGNLLVNAMAHTPLGGEIVLSLTSDGDTANIRVRDNGEGIPANDIDHVFERFYRSSQSRSDGRSGLGLAISLAIVKAHGGSISIESTVGVGTTVSVSLPLPSSTAVSSLSEIERAS